MKIGSKVKVIDSRTGIVYKITEYVGAGYYRLNSGDREFIDHADHLREVK